MNNQYNSEFYIEIDPEDMTEYVMKYDTTPEAFIEHTIRADFSESVEYSMGIYTHDVELKDYEIVREKFRNYPNGTQIEMLIRADLDFSGTKYVGDEDVYIGETQAHEILDMYAIGTNPEDWN